MGITVVEIPGEPLTSFVPVNRNDDCYEYEREKILSLVHKLTCCIAEPYADIISIVASDKFTPQHAILLSALLRHMDCCDWGHIELFCK